MGIEYAPTDIIISTTAHNEVCSASCEADASGGSLGNVFVEKLSNLEFLSRHSVNKNEHCEQ